MYIERLSFDELRLVTNAMPVIRPLTLFNLLYFKKKKKKKTLLGKETWFPFGHGIQIGDAKVLAL